MRKKTVLRNLQYQCRAFCFVLLTVCVSGILSLLTSCSTEIENKPDSKKGKKVPVNFTLNIGAYPTDDPVQPDVRSATSANFNRGGELEEAIDFVHIANNVYMYATLVEENPVNLRSIPTNIPNNTVVRIIAYNASSVVVDFKDYKVISGSLEPETTELSVPDGASYRFAAYAMDSTSTAVTSHVDDLLLFDMALFPNCDLLWGCTALTPITGTSSVSITLVHKLSRIKVEMSTYNVTPYAPIEVISDAFVSPHSTMGPHFLNLISGVITNPSPPPSPGKQITQWRAKNGVAAWGTLNDTIVESNYYTIFTNNANEVALKIGGLQIRGALLADNTTVPFEWRFTKKLEPGRSYLLRLNIVSLIWAGSNIFWEANGANSRLTFLHESTPEELQGYQGVFFKWGSLVGISPRNHGSAAFDPAATKLFVPPVSGGNWLVQYAAGPNAWSGGSLAQIPSTPGASLVSGNWLDNHSARNYLSETAIHVPAQFRGDICKYLSDNGYAPPGNWRMPNGREFGKGPSDYISTGSVDPPGLSLVAEDGTQNYYDVRFGAKRTILTSTIFFPNSGYREPGGNTFVNITKYLSGSPVSTTVSTTFDACFQLYLPITASLSPNTPSLGALLQTQGPVRCVKGSDAGQAIPFTSLLPSVQENEWVDGGTKQQNVWY